MNHEGHEVHEEDVTKYPEPMTENYFWNHEFSQIFTNDVAIETWHAQVKLNPNITEGIRGGGACPIESPPEGSVTPLRERPRESEFSG